MYHEHSEETADRTMLDYVRACSPFRDIREPDLSDRTRPAPVHVGERDEAGACAEVPRERTRRTVGRLPSAANQNAQACREILQVALCERHMSGPAWGSLEWLLSNDKI